MKDSLRENISSLLPIITDFEKVFWESLQNKKLMIQKCNDCGHTQFPPSPVCIECLSNNVKWIECSGKATLWSKVTFHKVYLKPYPDVPYTVIIAKLAEGHIITGRMSEEDVSKAHFDSPLLIGFCETLDGTVLIEFELDNC